MAACTLNFGRGGRSLNLNHMPKNIKFIVLVLLVVGGLIWTYRWYQLNHAANLTAETRLFIPTGAGFEQVLDSLTPFLKHPSTFGRKAGKSGYVGAVKPGRYTLEPGWSNKQILEKLAQGRQDEIAIRIGNYVSIMELAGRVAPFLETDSAGMVAGIMQSGFAKGLDTAEVLHFFIPNTYNFHWNTSGAEFARKLKAEYDKFWNADRKALLAQSGMTALEVTTLASIVQLESAKTDEQARVAGLYLNRLGIGMKLDADPTVVYILKKRSGFTRKVSRVYYKDLRIESPYNTYRNRGLPPSPICMPNPSAIDAVLQPEQHDYFYFVADTARPGYHLFAKTLAEQERNAIAYRRWLDENRIE